MAQDQPTDGELIRDAREARGYSQRRLAVALGVSNQAVSSWEADRVAPSVKNRHDLQKFLDIRLKRQDRRRTRRAATV